MRLWLVLSLIGNAVLLVGLVFAALALRRHRAKYKGRGLFWAWPIAEIALDHFDPCFTTDELGPDLAAETRFIPSYRIADGISDRETWILTSLARTRERIFEFGTGIGKTTYLLAANAPASARVLTLTLPPDPAATPGWFYYTGTPEVANIEQLYGDSREFDWTPYAEFFDLIFIDGSHDRAVVENDTQKALAMLKPGGIVLWHDYRGPRARGMFRTLNTLAKELPLAHLEGTTLVAYRKPFGD